MKTNRIFKTKSEDGSELVYEFRRPTQKVVSRGELIRRQKFAEAMRAGALMNAEVAELLKSRGVWGDEQEEKARKVRQEINELEDSLKDPKVSNKEGMEIVKKIKDKRAEHARITAVLTNASDATCEAMAQEELNMFFAAECTYNKTTGQKVYNDVEDFKSRLSEQATADALNEAMIASFEVTLKQDLPSDLSSRYAENKWLSERKLLEDSDDAEEEKPKKRGRKKKTASE